MAHRTSRRLLALALLLGTAACTAILGDFEVGSNEPAGDASVDATTAGDGATDGQATSDAAVDAPPGDAAKDAPPDGPFEAGPPIPDGGFLDLYTFGSTNTSPPGNMRVAFDKGGNLFILFAWSLANNDVFDASISPVGSFDVGLVKVSANGKLVWLKTFGSTAYDSPGGLAVDGNGDAYISGSTEGTSIDFGGTAGALDRACQGGTCSGRYLGWILKVDGATGNAVKAIHVDTSTLGSATTSNQGASCSYLAARKNRIAVSCFTYADIAFPMAPNGTVQTLTPPGAPTGLAVAVLDTSLNAIWANALGSGANDFGGAIAIAPNDDVVFAASVTPSAATSFADSKGTVSVPLSTLSQTALVGRLSANAGAGLWAKAFATDTSNYVSFNGLGVDAQDRVAAIGTVTGQVMLGTKMAGVAGHGGDILLATFAGNDGTPTDTRTYGGTSNDNGSAIAIDQFDTLALTGTYASTNMTIGSKAVPDPAGSTTSGFMARSAPNLDPHWAAGFTTALSGTFLQAWSVATDPSSGRVAAAGTYKGLINFGNNDPVRSIFDGGAYNVWVVVRRP